GSGDCAAAPAAAGASPAFLRSERADEREK
ncbi:hypothetical protein A2U01_0052052, partial [Trifolium medium]|nr:hypothetical protein [Trifolium medium]